MNRKTSPTSRSGRRQSSASRGGASQPAAPRAKRNAVSRVATKVRDNAQARVDTRQLSMPARIRRGVLSVLVADGAMFALIVAVCLAVVLLTASPMAWLPTAIAHSWMVANGVGVSAADIQLAFVPLLPAVLLFVMVARRVYTAVRKRVSITDLGILLASVVIVPLAFGLTAWFMLWDAAKVYDTLPPPLVPALVKIVVFHLLAMAVGMSPRLWRALARRYNVPAFIVDSAVTAIRFLGLLAALSAVVVLVLFAAGWDRQLTLLQEYPNLSGLGLTSIIALSIAYIPNAIIAVGTVLLGAEFHIGNASLSLFDTHLVALPPLPIAAIAPGSSAAWAPVLLVLPLLAALAAVWRSRPTILQALATGAWAAVFSAFIAWLGTGMMGSYGFIGPMFWLTVGLSAAWTAGIGLAVAMAWMVAHRNGHAGAQDIQQDAELPADTTDTQAAAEPGTDEAEPAQAPVDSAQEDDPAGAEDSPAPEAAAAAATDQELEQDPIAEDDTEIIGVTGVAGNGADAGASPGSPGAGKRIEETLILDGEIVETRPTATPPAAGLNDTLDLEDSNPPAAGEVIEHDEYDEPGSQGNTPAGRG
ncbi:cell division protein PerM [Corynebacterium phocae]|uniref:cell division protein PerM n=1 Tax=Corynebacterium phocae TaxID=161895 RepID=UPI000951B963|nr:DUF6350 family protein [Corynebacterium phocae]KAA8723318.1 hypothetical protein F4V58_08370 [Corynebacterium phocae]